MNVADIRVRSVPVAPGVDVGGQALALIAGPCVIESLAMALEIAQALQAIARRLKMPFIFKSSFDKANRSSIDSYRGPGMDAGLGVLRKVREAVGVPVLTDVHLPDHAQAVSQVADVLQVPAYLCRQTDLILACANTGKTVNVKKGQFLSPQEAAHIVHKIEVAGNRNILITERGTSFGYNCLVNDMRCIPIVRSFGVPLVFDATHSVQLPGGLSDRSGGQREFVPTLACAAVAAGADAIFLEVHPDPDRALSDGPNMLPLSQVEPLLARLLRIREAAA